MGSGIQQDKSKEVIDTYQSADPGPRHSNFSAGVDPSKVFSAAGINIAEVKKALTQILHNADIGTGPKHKGAHDGKISREEAYALNEDVFGHPLTALEKANVDHDIPAKGAKIDDAVKRVMDPFNKEDLNHDGIVSPRELKEVQKKHTLKETTPTR